MSLRSRIDAFGRRAPLFPPGPVPAVVLGARVYADGTASDALVDRVRVGVELFQQGHASQLVFTGGSPDTRATEAQVMRALAAQVPDDAILLERSSLSTRDNARLTAAMLDAREILLVTCDFHLARATAWFRDAGFTVWPIPSPRRLSAADRRMALAREALGLLAHPRLLRHVV